MATRSCSIARQIKIRGTDTIKISYLTCKTGNVIKNGNKAQIYKEE
jgi:hypothetical protein